MLRVCWNKTTEVVLGYWIRETVLVEHGLCVQIALWRARAAEARALAAEMPSTAAKAVFDQMALSYQKMADSAEADLKVSGVARQCTQPSGVLRKIWSAFGTRKPASRSE
jgi:hypothetical protein